MWRVVAWTLGLWWLAHLVLIAGHVLLVFVYSIAVAPGLEHADYQAFAETSAPWFSIVAGGPVFYALGRLLRKRVAPSGRRAGLVVWGLYSATDLAIVLASGFALTPLFAGQWVTSQAIKLFAVLLATRDAGE